MKRLLLLFTFALAVLLSPLTAKGQTIVEATMDTASILVGEQVQVKLKCTANKGQRIQFPNFSEQQEVTPGVEVVSSSKIDTTAINDGKRIELERRYTITSFDSALYTLPPFYVEIDGKRVASRGTLGLKVNTIDVDTVHVDKFRDAHDVVEEPFTWRSTLLLLALAAWLCAGLAFALWTRLSNPKLISRRIVVHPPTPPHQTAVEHITQIRQQAANTDSKAYYMALTDTLRKYIQERFGFNANEMTTSEIINRLTSNNDYAALAELRSVLEMADLVKFAKLQPSMEEQDNDLMQALSYVQATKIVPAVAPKPHVEYVSLSDKKQSRLRLAMLFGGIALTLAALALTCYIVFELYQCYA